MDIAFATARRQGVDLGYKTAMIDVSQNVDRNHFTRPGITGMKSLGIIGCITPSGMPIVTDLMRAVTGTETLALQGLPVDELVTSTETQSQLRDLAGNAMTVTVVGAVALALILAVARLKSDLFPQLQPCESQRGLFLEPRHGQLLACGQVSATADKFDPAELLTLAKRMVRICHCPIRGNGIFVCNSCNAAACSACRGNPRHNFSVAKAIGPMISAEQGKVDLRNQLPDVVSIRVPSQVVQQASATAVSPLYRSVVLEILNGDETLYYFDEIKVTEVVTVHYKAINSIARLVISPDEGCCWYILIAPWHNRRAELSKVFDLDQPLARGQLSQGLGSPEWSVWVHGRIDLTLHIAKDSAGAVVASNLTFAGRRPTMLNPWLVAWKQTAEREVCGTYIHYPECGTAGNALRIKQVPTAEGKAFMMWESTKLGAPDLDHFVWTRTARRLEPHEYRETFLHASSTLPWDLASGLGTVSVFWPGYWSTCPERTDVLRNQGLSAHVSPRSVTRIKWGSTQTIQGASCHMDGQSPVTSMPIFAALDADLSRFPISSAQAFKIHSTHTNGRFYVIPTSERDAFLRRFACLSSRVRAIALPGNLTNFQHLQSTYIPIKPCQECSVAPPEITVYAKEENSGTAKKDKKFKKVIIEDPDQAAMFERQFLDLPRAIAVAARLASKSDQEATLEMRIMLQPRTLASRALAFLRQAHRTASRGSLALSSKAKTSFKVVLDYADPSWPDFTPFRNSLRPCGEDLTGIDLGSSWEEPGTGPPRFCREIVRQGKKAPIQHKLRPSQKDAVNWMLQRERAPFDFVEVEIEEEVVRPLNLRVTGKAEWTNRFPYSSRGGVVAHEIGYGKTVVTLALLDYSRGFDQTNSIAERKEKVDSAWSEELSGRFQSLRDSAATNHKQALALHNSFFIHLAATLVIAPKHITDQWAKEAERFLGLAPGPRIIVIKTAQGFYGKYTLEQLKNAELIIVSSAVFGASFLDRMQTISGGGADYPKGLSGRALEVWYRQSLRNHRILVAYYLSGIAAGAWHDELMRTIWEGLLPDLVKKQQKEDSNLWAKQATEIDRRLYKVFQSQPANRGGVNAAQAQSFGGELERYKSKLECKETAKLKFGANHWDISWLHSCSFARVVWDECSYDDDKNSNIPLFVANAVANAKWLLSGTPKLFDLGDVCRIASAFGIHVARPEPRLMPGLSAVTKGVELDQTSKSEQFHVFSSPVKSVTLAQERHTQGHAFVASYFRANTLEENQEIPFEEHVLPVAMAESIAVRYYLLNQEVLDAGYDYTALPAHARSEVAMKGVDLATADGVTLSKMLLGLLACGLSREEKSMDALKQSLVVRTEILSDQMKQRWDKMMWLRRWILELKPEDTKFEFSDPVQSILAQVNSLCEYLRKALVGHSGPDASDDMAIPQSEAVVIAAQTQDCRGNTKIHTGSLRSEWERHFPDGWADHYHKDKALYTWLDFFDVGLSAVGTLTDKQLRLLAQDICLLRYKSDQQAAPLEREHLSLEFLPGALALRGYGARTRVIPDRIGALADGDLRSLSGLEPDKLRDFINDCIKAKPKKQTRDGARNTAKSSGTSRGKLPKTTLVARLAELNLKFNPNGAIDTLEQLLWEHEKGLTACEHYRDGRAAPSRYRDFAAATGCGKETSKQIDAATEELKHTMVHLAKTVEDLRATRLEANFIPSYASLTPTNRPGDGATGKFCEKCQQPLGSTSCSFLVVACGHFLCGECRYQSGFYCPVKGCTAFIRKRPILRCSQVRRSCDDEGRPKAECVAELIKDSIPKEDHVLVFAQYRPLIDALDKAFKKAGLVCTNLAATKDDEIAKKLEDFKAGKAGQILLLDIDSETSAGSNLTNATHVIFANPYMHHDEDHQARTVRQARGRCIRIGQERKVHVYHFMVPGTIEEETLRRLSKHSEGVKAFFDGYEHIPWWMDIGEDNGEQAASGDAA
ncbi:hypothetical protein VTK26DRAFT_23 [Humicola hyalothermophila]